MAFAGAIFLAALASMLERLEQVDRAVHRIRAPLAYTENLSNFREHVELVRRRIEHRLATPAQSAEEPAGETLAS